MDGELSRSIVRDPICFPPLQFYFANPRQRHPYRLLGRLARPASPVNPGDRFGAGFAIDLHCRVRVGLGQRLGHRDQADSGGQLLAVHSAGDGGSIIDGD